ncbi:MAG: FAD-dependent oxidoreductase [Anaerolineales bacterium]
MEKLGVAPCRGACPAGQRAQGYIALITEGRYREALRVIKEDNPFPSVCGRTCHHPCEGYCARSLVDEPVAIMSLKRFVVDYALAYGREKVDPAARTKPHWVAVVGAGPAGLTAAHDLAKMGYGVTVYEALPVAGGMMRVGIPAHRLPKGILQQDIDDILALGVVLKTDTPVPDPVKLLGKGYDAVCVATGISSRDHSLGLDGEEAEGVISAAAFLRKINLGEPFEIGGHVAVVGGGITALDAAAVARRLGAQEVFLALDRPRGELPAYHWEMAAVEAEGIRLLEHTTPIRILTEDGRVIGIELAQTAKGMVVDEHGRRRPKIKPGTETTLDVDTVIITAGQQSDLCFLDSHYDDLIGDPGTLASEYGGVFVVGGRKTGASYIIDAVALGHRVAVSIDRYLLGKPLLQPDAAKPPVIKITREQIAQRVEAGEFHAQAREEPALLSMEERVIGFREVILGFTELQARAEASRCLQCGLCSECLACVYACGTDAINHDAVEVVVEIDVGAVILAPGYQIFRAEHAAEYGLGRHPNVITSLQLERLLNASGPTQGEVLRPSDEKLPRKVAFLQCVGSRDQSHDYCSAVCCMYATKEAMLLKEHHPDTDVHVFLMDMRAFSKGYEAYFQRAQDQFGIKYTRCRISAIEEDPESSNLILRHSKDEESDAHSGDLFQITAEEFDLVVLSVGMEVSASVRELGHRLGIELDDFGFFRTPTFHPTETNRPGIFAVGPIVEPKDIPESIVDASSAAGMTGDLLALARGTLAREAVYPEELPVEQESPRVGVFVCHCGSNIAGFLDVEDVTATAAQLPHVVHAESLLYACSQDSTSLIQERIEEQQLNRVVVASCTPLTHGPLFKDIIRQAGLNEHLFSMANIRNHCSWVHSEDPEIATAKAKTLVQMSVARVVGLEPLTKTPVAIHHSALVIGGGIAGLISALTLADQGFPVHIIERDAVLGGNLRHIHLSLPEFNVDDHTSPQTYLSDVISRVESHPKITLRMKSDVVATQGFVGNFTTQVVDSKGDRAEIQHGVTIVASGGQEYRGQEYGYGAHPRIVTLQQFESLLATGAYSDDDSETRECDLHSVNQIVMIQCVGPAEQYCARTCCTIALKNAVHLKKLYPETEIVILHRDIRTYGFKERIYREARELGVIFVRYDGDRKPEVEPAGSDHPLHVRVLDTTMNIPLVLEPDLLVLSMPMVPSEGYRELARALKVPVDMDGWFLEAHVKLRPVEFASSGIFLAGAAHYPKLLDETIAQAQAAASRAAVILSQEMLSAGGAIAQVDPQACVGCLTCVRICPFSVPEVKNEFVGVAGIAGTAYIEPTICQGCGTCVGECPANAIELLHYTHQQVEAQVLSLFEVGAASRSD